jgi:hypothetical protein
VSFLAVEEVLNQRALAQLLRRSTDPVMVVKGVSPLGKDKRTRSTSSTVLAHSGRLLLPSDDPAFPVDAVVGQLTRFTGEPGMPDDIADTLFYACELLPQVATLSLQGKHNAPTHYSLAGPFDRHVPRRTLDGRPVPHWVSRMCRS